jgi:hypothetical protein
MKEFFDGNLLDQREPETQLDGRMKLKESV